MLWQDMVFSLGSTFFFIALLPSILGKDKPALATSLITGAVMAAFVFTYASLSLWTSAAFSALISASWFTLAFQKYSANKKELTNAK